MWAGIDKNGDGGCWLWLGALQRDGYAHFNRGGKTVSLHRYMYERLVGPIPEGMDLLHSCDVRHCVNPDHVSPGTHQENMADCCSKKRHAWGERNKHAVLTSDLVREIRKEFKFFSPGRTNARELSKKYGVRTTTLYLAATGRTWRNVE